MQDGLFFRVLRRFNIIWVALLGIGLIAGSGYHLWRSPFLRHEVLGTPFATPAVSLGTPAKMPDLVVEPESYGTADTHYGPNENTVMVLNRYNPFPTVPSVDDYGNFIPKQAVNLMIVDTKTGDGHWLFPSNKQLITMRDALYEGAPTVHTTPATDQRPVIGMVMVVTDKDTDKDGAITIKDQPSLYVWTKGMAAPKKLLTMDEMISIGQFGSDRYDVLYKAGKQYKSAIYTIPEFKLLSEKVVPDAPH